MTPEATTDTDHHLRRLWVLIAASCIDMIGFAMNLPLLPFAYRHFGHAMPFYLAGATVALVSILAFKGASGDR